MNTTQEITEIIKAIEANKQEEIDVINGKLWGKSYQKKLKDVRANRRVLEKKLKEARDNLNYQNVLF